MAIDNNGPQSPYPGPAEPGSDDELYPDAEGDLGHGQEGESLQGDQSDDPDLPVNPPVDEDEEPSPGSSA